MTIVNKKSLTFLAFALASGVLSAQESERTASQLSLLQAQLGLRAESSLRSTRSHVDEGAIVHHLQQYHQGLKVWGAFSGAREENGEMRVVAKNIHEDINISLEPTLTVSEIQNIVDGDLLRGTLASMPKRQRNEVAQSFRGASVQHLNAPVTELVILPIEEARVRPEAAHKRPDQLNAEDMTYVITGYRLAYHVDTDADVAGSQELMNYLVDAHTGEILESWNLVRHAAGKKGTVKSKYSGNITLYTNQSGSGYEAKDPIYAANYVVNASGSIYTDSDNAWGNGGNYADGSTDSKNTGAAECLYALQRETQMLKAVYGINSFDGKGSSMKCFWGKVPASNTACATSQNYMLIGYADNYFGDMQKLEIIGHEYGHAFDYRTAGFCRYSIGEGSRISEGHADIMGLLTKVYGKYAVNNPDNPSTTIPEEGLDDPETWLCGDKVASSKVNGGKALRFFIRPSDDKLEGTIDAWKVGMEKVEVHAAAGPIDRMFYYLSAGAPSDKKHAGYTNYLPNGSKGIGLHKAGMIWIKTVTSGRVSASSKFTELRDTCAQIATDLYGATEAQAVKAAFAGINVGTVTTTPTQELMVNPATVTLESGKQQTFQLMQNGKVVNATWTVVSGGGSFSGASYKAPVVTSVSTATVKGTTSTGASATATVTIKPTQAQQVSVGITPATVTLAPGKTQSFSAVVTGSNNTAVTWSATNGTVTSSGYYTAPSTSGVYRVRATSKADATKFAEAIVTVDAGGIQPTGNLALGKPATASSSYAGRQTSWAVDGDANTYWASSAISQAGTTQWFAVDLGRVSTVKSARIKWSLKNFPKRWALQYQEGTQWKTAAQTQSGKGGQVEMSVPSVSARNWRVYATSNNSAYYTIYELELLGQGGNSIPQTQDTVAPKVSASVKDGGSAVALNATASDNVGVTRVDFVVDGTKVASDSTAPYSFNYTAPAGTHTLVALAYDAAGNEGRSAEVDFTVDSDIPASLPDPDMNRIKAGMNYLCSNECAGRLTGSAGERLAGNYIANFFEEAGLKPVKSGGLGGSTVFHQPWAYGAATFMAADENTPTANAWWLSEDVSRAGQAMNIVGMIPGTDSVLKNEYIVVSAHYDHLGKSSSAIYRGADDNASGTVGLMETAQCLKNSNPKRSIIFVAFSGEEKGLLGSAAFLKNCPVSVSAIKANINLDMIGRNSADEVHITPAKKDGYVSTLCQDARSIASNHGVTLSGGIDQYFQQSDHYSFASKRIPSIFFNTNDHADLHKTTDTVDKINFEKMRTIIKITRDLALKAANDKAAPAILNKNVWSTWTWGPYTYTRSIQSDRIIGGPAEE